MKWSWELLTCSTHENLRNVSSWALDSLSAGLSNKLKSLSAWSWLSFSLWWGSILVSHPTLGPALTPGAIIYAHSPDLRDLECVNRHLHIGAVPEIGTPLGCMPSITSGAVAPRSESWLARRHEQTPPSLTVPRWLLKFARDIIYSYLVWLGLRQIGLEYQELPCAILRNGPDSPRSASS